jgi:hypothetical protein
MLFEVLIFNDSHLCPVIIVIGLNISLSKSVHLYSVVFDSSKESFFDDS